MYHIIKSTDSKFLGRDFQELPSVGSNIVLSDKFSFTAEKIVRLDWNMWVVGDSNYLITLELIV